MKRIAFVGMMILAVCAQASARDTKDCHAEKVAYTYDLGDMTNMSEKDIDAAFADIPKMEEVADNCTVTVTGKAGPITITVSSTSSDCHKAAKNVVKGMKDTVKDVKNIVKK